MPGPVVSEFHSCSKSGSRLAMVYAVGDGTWWIDSPQLCKNISHGDQILTDKQGLLVTTGSQNHFNEKTVIFPSLVTTTKEVIRRSFAYTRQQWTGKSPKQFLNDWVRKHLPQSSTLTFEKVDIGGGLWKSRSVTQGGAQSLNC